MGDSMFLLVVCLYNGAIVFRITSHFVCVLVYLVCVNGLFCNYFVSIFAVKRTLLTIEIPRKMCKCIV